MTIRIDDGFSTTIGFAENGAVKFWEKSVTPPGMAGGGANDTTTMRNIALRTRAPKSFKTLTESSAVCSYDPAVFDQIYAMINVNQLITITFADGSTYAFWGWLDEFKPNECAEGEQPTANVTIIPSNQNASLVETNPVYTPG